MGKEEDTEVDQVNTLCKEEDTQVDQAKTSCKEVDTQVDKVGSMRQGEPASHMKPVLLRERTDISCKGLPRRKNESENEPDLTRAFLCL